MFITRPAGTSPGDIAGKQSRVVLLSMPRTGSTMITRYLNKHSKIFFVGAMFSIEGWLGDGPGRRPIKEGLSPEWDELPYRVENRLELMERVFTAFPKARCVGFKHHMSGPPEVTETVLADPAVAKILLYRANILACFASESVARMKVAGQPGKPVFVPEEFTKYLRIRRGIYKRWKEPWEQGAGDLTVIEYLDARTQEGKGSLVDFLGYKREELEQVTPKRGSDHIVSRFENPDDVSAYLAENDLAHWTEEGSSTPIAASTTLYWPDSHKLALDAGR